MARREFHLPDIGEGIAEAEIVAWHVRPGDRIDLDTPLVDMMTDKATVEIESPFAGRVLETIGAVGDQVPIQSLLVVFEVEDDFATDATTAPAIASPSVSPPDSSPPDPAQPSVSEPVAAAALVAAPADRVLASPAVRARAKDLQIDLAQLRPVSGNRIRHGDLDAWLLYHQHEGSTPHPIRPGKARTTESEKLIGLRRRIARNMSESKRHIPHFSYVEDVDITALDEGRRAINAGRRPDERLTLLPFIARAICMAIDHFPAVNAHYDDDSETVTRFATVELGIATQTDLGLMVPVVKQADQLDVMALAHAIASASASARDGGRTGKQSGSTITISSLGALGGLAATPVINRPEVAIIGVNKAVERPMIHHGRIEPRLMMNLSSSFDHRIIDGWVAASFVQEIRRLLQTPMLLGF